MRVRVSVDSNLATRQGDGVRMLNQHPCCLAVNQGAALDPAIHKPDFAGPGCRGLGAQRRAAADAYATRYVVDVRA